MKTTAIACAVLAGSLGFSGMASAQQWTGHQGGHRFEQRQAPAQAAPAQVQPAPAQQAPARQAPTQHWQQGQAQAPSGWNGAHPQRFAGQQPRYNDQQRRFAYNAPRYAYNSGYYAHGPRFYRGGYLPRAYMDPGYYVDYRAYPGLYAPPYGYQWMNVDGEFLLVALTSGLIANLLINGGF